MLCRGNDEQPGRELCCWLLELHCTHVDGSVLVRDSCAHQRQLTSRRVFQLKCKAISLTRYFTKSTIGLKNLFRKADS